ncbi:hypothetical protein D3C81_1142490 [compost metagenome]
MRCRLLRGVLVDHCAIRRVGGDCQATTGQACAEVEALSGGGKVECAIRRYRVRRAGQQRRRDNAEQGIL